MQQKAKADQGFSFRGTGAQKILWGRAHYEREARNPIRPGYLTALEPLGLFDAPGLSCYLSLVLKHMKNGGGGGAVTPVLGGGVP